MHPSLSLTLQKYSAGPTTGIFTDGSATPNPGSGGWGFIHVANNELIHQENGFDSHTTNNRMELTALIHALKYLPKSTEIDIYSDSNLCVKTINEWAINWERRGWKKKGGEIANLELVKELWSLHKSHPKCKFVWIKAHNGWRWNEYVDVLAGTQASLPVGNATKY